MRCHLRIDSRHQFSKIENIWREIFSGRRHNVHLIFFLLSWWAPNLLSWYWITYTYHFNVFIFVKTGNNKWIILLTVQCTISVLFSEIKKKQFWLIFWSSARNYGQLTKMRRIYLLSTKVGGLKYYFSTYFRNGQASTNFTYQGTFH